MELRVRSGPRGARFPLPLEDTLNGIERSERDDAIGLAAWRLLAEALGRGLPPPAVLLLGSDVVHLVDVVPLLRAGEKLDGRGVAGFASLPNVEVMALIGVLQRRSRGVPNGRFGVAFLEWPDGRWWLAQRPVHEQPEGRLALDPLVEVNVERAVDGRGKPGGIGGWFRRARVEGLRASLSSALDN